MRHAVHLPHLHLLPVLRHRAGHLRMHGVQREQRDGNGKQGCGDQVLLHLKCSVV
jgi:hypothetical protein